MCACVSRAVRVPDKSLSFLLSIFCVCVCVVCIIFMPGRSVLCWRARQRISRMICRACASRMHMQIQWVAKSMVALARTNYEATKQDFDQKAKKNIPVKISNVDSKDSRAQRGVRIEYCSSTRLSERPFLFLHPVQCQNKCLLQSFMQI